MEIKLRVRGTAMIANISIMVMGDAAGKFERQAAVINVVN